MTDKEFMKALECCILGDCQGCLYGDTDQRHCRDDLMQNALDLINRQKAEIERLNRDYSTAVETMSNSIRTIGAEKEALIAGQETLQKALNEKIAKIENYERYMGNLARKNRELLHSLKRTKSEAVKEFAERLKEKTSNAYFFGEYYIKNTIDNLVKEMEGEG